jgi:hypothetical protein
MHVSPFGFLYASVTKSSIPSCCLRAPVGPIGGNSNFNCGGAMNVVTISASALNSPTFKTPAANSHLSENQRHLAAPGATQRR